MNANVVYENYGVSLRALQAEDLEFLRARRNDPLMRQWMTTDHEITADEMRNWFARLPATSHYLLVDFQGRCVGHVNAKLAQDLGVDETYQTGYLFWDEVFQSEGGVLRAVFAFYNYLFDVLHVKRIGGFIAKDNRRARRFASLFEGDPLDDVTIDGREYVRGTTSAEQYARTLARYEFTLT